MSVYIDSESKYLDTTLGAEAPTAEQWKLITCWTRVLSSLGLNSTNVATDLQNADGALLQVTCNASRAAVARGEADSSQGTVSVSSGETLTDDAWSLQAALVGPDAGVNTILKSYSASGSTLNSNTTTAASNDGDTAAWNTLTIGNNLSHGAFNDWKGRIADVAIFTPTSEAEADSILTEILNSGGTPRAANNLTAKSPIWYAQLKSDATVTTGAALSETGTPTYDNTNHPTLLEATPTNPLITVGPTLPTIGETTATVRATADADCTFQVVVLSGHDQLQPDDTTFDGSSFNASATADVPQDVNLTGLTAITQYTVWLRAKGLSGGSSDYGSINLTTTVAAPTITTVNSGNPLNEGSSITVTGSGFTGHTTATIDGTTQTSFNVVNDTTVTFTATLPVGLKFGATGVLNIGGTTDNISMLPQTGWDYVDILSVFPTKADRIDEGQAFDIAVNDQVTWDINGAQNVVVQDDGRVTADSTGAFNWKIFDSSDTTWGTENTYTVTEAGAGSTLRTDRLHNSFCINTDFFIGI